MKIYFLILVSLGLASATWKTPRPPVPTQTARGPITAPTRPMPMTAPGPTVQPIAPTDMCFQCRTKRNQKDMYADMTDCHFYYQCFYFNETTATGIRRQCPQGTFWHDAVLSCMPEGPIPCQDRCMEDATAAKGCYAGIGCRQFFMCSNTASYGMCCPETMRFDEATCGCAQDETCQDQCVQVAPPVPTVVAPAQQFNATVCMDSFGSYIATVPGEDNAYYQLDQEGQATEKMYCPDQVSFDLTTCRCNIESELMREPQTQRRQATLWLPFDTDLQDHSVNRFTTFAVDTAELDRSTFATGTGSLLVNNGLLSIPGLKSFDLRNQASFCAFFKSQSGQSGAILSNYMNENDYTVVMGTQKTANTFIGKLHFWHPVGAQSVQGTFQPPANGWSHVCLTYDAMAIRLYLNGALVDTQFVGGFLSIAGCPYTVGFDAILGYFIGNIDDVLITPFAMTQEEIEAHRRGDIAFLNALGFGLGGGPPLPPPPRPAVRPAETGAVFNPVPKQGNFFVISQAMTWQQAVSACQASGAQLASVLSPTDLVSARNVMAASPQFNRFWAAGQGMSNWRWIDGTLVSNQYWKPGEPSTGSLPACCTIDKSGFNIQLLGTDNCGTARQALCEFGFPKQYQFLGGFQNWGSARTACSSQFSGGRLAVIQSDPEMFAAQNALQNTGTSTPWVGCSREANMVWQWTNGMPIGNNLWQFGQPSGSGLCAYFMNGFLFNSQCSDLNAVLCRS